MIEELANASNRLRAALDHYVRICANVQEACLQGAIPQNITPEYIEQVERELGMIESYDVKMQLAKTAIKITHNYAFTITSINRLPTEILTRIFRINRSIDPSSVYYISLVCSRWHTIALQTPSLWTRIDFHPHFCKSFYPSLSRARTHVLRSGEMPLDIHVSAASGQPNENYYDGPMGTLCRLAAPRMESLEIDFGGFNSDQLSNSTHSAISNLFLYCNPGLLTKISTFSEHFGFLTSDPTGPVAWAMKLGVENFHLEAILSSVTVLHLTGLYPPWTSRAYHGLVELRLITSPTGPDSIPERQLINILQSSPGLRIVHTSLQITHRMEENLSISVTIPELEVLQVDSEGGWGENLGYLELVRFLTPGLRPLSFTMQCSDLQLIESSKAHTKAFLERSNVTQFHADRVPYPFDLLSFMPHLKALIFSSCVALPVDRLSPDDLSNSQNTTLAVYPKLDICLVIQCSMPLDEFRTAIERCQVRTLMIYSSRFYRGIDKHEVSKETVLRELLEVCPNVNITKAIPRFVEHRGFFFDYTLPVSHCYLKAYWA
ncbi:unnamed protein product [Rhizoctonia solani]|uniref:F-box domain-containing protein n=1 Tax=Rhizoctonia solani TaxID=456999 RepID=A0A8H3CZ85_9AGAM|nr:unnamed protein product [Rhizoctonia solani]